ncbi:MAG TPA: hypothetical protein VFN42_01930 [Acetobacteraceae bacterium]|nr:hypothetical protein [Acetobacteraceae bacterium]
MKVRMRLALPLVLTVAGCATTTPPLANSPGPVAQTSAAPPQRVSAASDALGHQLDSMLANYRPASTTLTR